MLKNAGPKECCIAKYTPSNIKMKQRIMVRRRAISCSSLGGSIISPGIITPVKPTPT
jgi:hypothetical protein